MEQDDNKDCPEELPVEGSVAAETLPPEEAMAMAMEERKGEEEEENKATQEQSCIRQSLIPIIIVTAVTGIAFGLIISLKPDCAPKETVKMIVPPKSEIGIFNNNLQLHLMDKCHDKYKPDGAICHVSQDMCAFYKDLSADITSCAVYCEGLGGECLFVSDDCEELLEEGRKPCNVTPAHDDICACTL